MLRLRQRHAARARPSTIYDDATSETTPPTLGRLTKQIDGYGGTEATTQYTYWPNGNPRQVIDPLNRTTETFYDSRFQAYPVCTKNALGQPAKQRYYGVPGSGDANCPTNTGYAVWSGSERHAHQRPFLRRAGE